MPLFLSVDGITWKMRRDTTGMYLSTRNHLRAVELQQTQEDNGNRRDSGFQRLSGTTNMRMKLASRAESLTGILSLPDFNKI